MRTPRSKAACASAAVASLCPQRDRRRRAPWSRSISSSAPGSSGASVISRTGPAASRRSSSARIGVAPRRQPVRAEPPRGEERPLEVDAEDARRRGASAGTDAERGDEVALLGCGDERRQVRRHAGLEQRLARRGDSRRASAPRKSTPAKPFTWRSTNPGAAMPRPFGPSRPTACDRGRRRSRRRPGRAARRRALPRRRASSSRAPFGRRRRPRRGAPGRSSASTPARSETIATFASPPAARARRRRLPRTRRSASATMRRTRARSLSFVATTSTIRLPKVLPSRIIAIVESMLSTSFCAVPALSRVEPARTSGPTTTATSWSASAPSSEPSTHDDGDGARPAARAALERAEHVRRASAGADPTTASSGREPERAQLARPRRRRRPRRAPAAERSPHAARDERDDAVRADAERRLALGGVDAARGARTCPRRRRRAGRRARAARRSRRSRRRCRRRRSRDRGGDGRVLVVHQRRRARPSSEDRGRRPRDPTPRSTSSSRRGSLRSDSHLCQSMHAVVEWSIPMCGDCSLRAGMDLPSGDRAAGEGA